MISHNPKFKPGTILVAKKSNLYGAIIVNKETTWIEYDSANRAEPYMIEWYPIQNMFMILSSGREKSLGTDDLIRYQVLDLTTQVKMLVWEEDIEDSAAEVLSEGVM